MSCKPVSKERLEYAREVLWGGEPESETLDKLYLEWSQFTRAKTARELQLEAQLEDRDMLYEAGITAAREEIAKLEAQLEAVRLLPEKWSHGLVSGLDGSYWGAIDMCTDSIKAAIGEVE